MSFILNNKKTFKEETNKNIDNNNNIKKGRSHYQKITVNMPPEIIGELRDLSNKMKKKGKKDSGISTLVTYACIDFLRKNNSKISELIMYEKK